jgi:hypothetical protein
MEPCAQRIPRAPRACLIIVSPSTGQAVPLALKGNTRLDDTTNPMAFSESEQPKNRAGGMMPLYAARVQDLGTDDFVVFDGDIILEKAKADREGKAGAP